MSLVSGVALVVLALFVTLAAAHVKGLRYFDRPAIARIPFFDPSLAVLKWALLLSGLASLLRASSAACVVASALLLALWGCRSFVRSVFLQERLLRRDFAALKSDRPELSDEAILFELACRKHPRWGPELIEQMVRDHPSVESFARMLTRMERGFRGFKGRGAAGPGRRSRREAG